LSSAAPSTTAGRTRCIAAVPCSAIRPWRCRKASRTARAPITATTAHSALCNIRRDGRCAAGPELRRRQRREPDDCGGQIREGHTAAIADPGLPGAQIPVHVLHILQQDTLPGLQFDQAVLQLVEVVQEWLQDALPGFEQIADDPDRLVPIRGRQTRQPVDEAGTLARQITLEAPQLTGEFDDAQLHFVDRDTSPFQASLVNDDGRQLLDPLADQDAGRKGPSHSIQARAQFPCIAAELRDGVLEVREIPLHLADPLGDR
jgi:hypothetical protein